MEPIPSSPAAEAATTAHLEQPDRRDDDERRDDPSPAAPDVVLERARRPRWWLALFNLVVLQWFGVRLLPVVDDRGAFERWTLLRYVWPLTGWWSPFRWIARVVPPAARALTAAELTRHLAEAHAEIERLRGLKEPGIDQAGLDALVRMAQRQYHTDRVAQVNARIAAGGASLRPPPLTDFGASATYARGTRPAPGRDLVATRDELRHAMHRAADIAIQAVVDAQRAGRAVTFEKDGGRIAADAAALAADELGLVLS